MKFEFDSSGLRIDQNPAPPPAGNFWFSGEAFRIARVDESWYGVSMSRKLSDNVAVGFSPYVAQRNQRARTQIAAQLLDANTIYSDTYLVEEYKYWHIRMLLKAGVAAEWDKWSAGLAITTLTIWSGLIGGMFLAMGYFGCDQSQVQRYLSGRSLTDSRLSLLFNAFLKIPMQFLILLTGVLVFVFFHFFELTLKPWRYKICVTPMT